MGALIDLTGKIFNGIQVLERDKTVSDTKRAYWKCKCSCGNIFITRGESLRTGHTKSCGQCSQKQEQIKKETEKKTRYKDYTNQKIGKLTIIKLYNNPNDKKHTYWECLCECGNVCIKRSDSLSSMGEKSSCGCRKKNLTSLQWAAQLEGQKFGKLTVIKKVVREEPRSLWECKCECGNICYLPSRYLLSMGVSSCGCETKSFGELKIRQQLQELSLHFKEQYTFDNCIGNKNKLRFDFAILDEKTNEVKCVIEFNGKQHYESIPYFGGEERFKLQQQYDTIKREFCKQNNICLIEIPYLELSKLNISNKLQKYKLI